MAVSPSVVAGLCLAAGLVGGGGLLGVWEGLLCVCGCGLGDVDMLGSEGGCGLGGKDELCCVGGCGLGGAVGFGGLPGATGLGGWDGLLIGEGALPLFDIMFVDTVEAL